MNTLTFEAATLREAMRQVQESLGEHAVILGTRTLRPSGEETPARFQVTASVPGPGDPDDERHRYPATPETRRRERPRRPPDEPLLVPEVEDEPPHADPAPEAPEPPDAALAGVVEALRLEVSALRGVVDARGAGPADVREGLEALRSELRTMGRRLDAARTATPSGDPEVQQLVAAGAEPAVAAALVARARARAAPVEGLAVARPPDLEAEIARALPVTTPLWAREDQPVVALIGPSGVGKTRTLAKLAALATFVHTRRVGLVTTDVKRIGGVESLRAFCEILHLPLRRAATGRALRGAVQQLGRVDLVLVDTPAVGPWDEAGLARLADVLSTVGAERHLVVPASTPAAEVRTLARRLAPDGLASVLVTKLDEARGPAALLSAAWGAGAPLSHVCDGPDVPDACDAADASALARRILARAA